MLRAQQAMARMVVASSYQLRQVTLTHKWDPTIDLDPATGALSVRNWETYYPLRQLLSDWQTQCNIGPQTEGTLNVMSMTTFLRLGLRQLPTAATTFLKTGLQQANARCINYRHRGTDATLGDHNIFTTKDELEAFLNNEILPGRNVQDNVYGDYSVFDTPHRSIPFDVNSRSGKKTAPAVFAAPASRLTDAYLQAEPGTPAVEGLPDSIYWATRKFERFRGREPDMIKFTIDGNNKLQVSNDYGTVLGHNAMQALQGGIASPVTMILTTNVEFTITV